MTKRIAHLRKSTIERLNSDPDVDSYLEPDGGVIPAALAQDYDDLVPRISVGVSVNDLARDNKLEEKELQVRVIVDVTKEWLTEDESPEAADELLDAVGDVLTTHADGWLFADNADIEEFGWSDATDRYLAVAQTTAERTDTHKTHS